MRTKRQSAGIGERLRRVRKSLRLNQEAFAKRFGMTAQCVCFWERGEIPDSRIAQICNEYGVNEPWLRHGTGEMFRIFETSTPDELILSLLKALPQNARRRAESLIARLARR